MTISEVASIIEEFAPLSLQASYDNAGLIVGNASRDVESVLLAVDITPEVMQEAISLGVNMVITHHPLIFSPLKRLTSSNYIERCVETAIRNDIAIYAAHTNLDSAEGGMSWRLGEILGIEIESMKVLESTSSTDPNVGFGIVGTLPHPRNTREYITEVGKKLNCRAIRVGEITQTESQRIAICTGSGGSLIEEVRRCGADIYITADLRYNDFMNPSGEFTIVDVGHYESEYCAIDILFGILSKKMINFAVHKSQCTRNPISYISLQ